jgi:hypothetical protein
LPAAVPPRSRLYSLEPIGIGTPETESLTSYISRLAAAHSVRVRDLVISELLAHMREPHLAESSDADLFSAFWRNETRALNGTCSLARRMVHGLEEKTGRRDLRFLTLLTWNEVLPVHQLQKRTRAWCPGCYQDWHDHGQAIYDPLLWTLTPVTVCARHKRPLRTICPFPNCRRPSPWLGLGYRSRPGHCAHCGGWLGNPGGERSGTAEEKLVTNGAVRSHAWIFDALGELIAAAPSLPRRPQREAVLRGIEVAFRLAALRKITINRDSWMRYFGLASGTVLVWRKGQMPPSLWCLLEVCREMGISPLQLVRGVIDENDTDAAAPEAPADVGLDGPPIQHTRIDPVVIRRALEAVLASDAPTPSMRLVADRLGQTLVNLHHCFPELCRAIASRHRSYEEARDARTRTRMRETVRDAAIALTHRGLYPSASHIADLLGDRNVMRSHTAQAAWREVLDELGWQR